MSRISGWLLIVGCTLAAIMMLQGLTYDEPVFPEAMQPGDGEKCFSAGGEWSYCRCLEQRAAARARADQPVPPLPALDDPAYGAVLANPGRFPIINADTLYCLPRRTGGRADPATS